MTKKIFGDMESTHNITYMGKNTLRDINGINADNGGDLVFPHYTREEVDKIIKVLPVSRVGTMDYLPMNINGTFEGSTNVIGKGIYPVVLENDGNLVYLRPGTNGSTFGYYYSYISNARTVTSFADMVTTNERFIPSFFTQNHTLNSFIGSNANDILMMRTNNGTTDTYTLSLTNGTLNSDAHQSVEFSRTLIADTDPQFAMVHDGVVYIWGLNSYSNSSPLALSVYTISTSDIKNGIYNSLAKVTGISGETLFNDAISNSDSIKITESIFSNNISDKSLLCIEDGNVYRGISPFWGNNEGTVNAAGNGKNIRVAVFHGSEVTTQQKTSRNSFAISFVYNTETKEFIIDNDKNGSIKITTTENGDITWRNPYNMEYATKLSGINTTSSLNKVPTFFITNDGVQFCTMARHDTFVEHQVSRSNITNFTSLYDSWNVKNRQINSVLVNAIYPTYGSAIGENLIHPTLISKNKILLHCSGTYNGQYYDLNSTVCTELGNDRTYQYKSVNSGNILSGFAPNVNRTILNNDNNQYTALITVVDSTGSTKVYGSSFIEGYPTKMSGALLNQSTMQFSENISLSESLLLGLKNAIISMNTFQYSITDSRIAFYYVPDSSYTKSYAIVTLKDSTPSGSNNTYVLLAEVDVVISNNTITFVTPVTSYKLLRNIAASSISNEMMNRNGGLIIAKYTDFVYVGIPALFSVNTSGANFCSLLCKVDNSKLIINTPKLLPTAYNSSSANTYEVGVLPGIGFGLYENGSITDVKTKLIFKNFGTTSSQFDAMSANPASAPIERIVVASQDVPQGFVVYFSQEVPVLLGGVYKKLPSTSIDLSTIDPSPANKTFYLYVVLNENLINYVVSKTILSEELYRTYIGTVVTGSSNIISIQSEKVSRFLKYRTSTTKRGSAISTSTGLPSGTGIRWK